jgi:predicted NAD-dependent protein-ADP-ribosyltransferase YbiA (DUF1768 family)
MNMAHYYQYYISPKTLKPHVLRATCISRAEAFNWECYSIAKDAEKHIMKYDATETIKRLLDALIENCKQNPCIKTVLKLTGSARLRYYDDNDSFLGCGRDNYGLNAMGIIIMLARRFFTFKQRDSIAEEDLSTIILHITAIKKGAQIKDDEMPTLLPPVAVPLTVVVGGPLSTIYESDSEENES